MTVPAIDMQTRKRIALIAHDCRETDLLDWARFNRGTLAEHELFASRTDPRPPGSTTCPALRLSARGGSGGPAAAVAPPAVADSDGQEGLAPGIGHWLEAVRPEVPWGQGASGSVSPVSRTQWSATLPCPVAM